jgi:hypothetical protein
MGVLRCQFPADRFKPQWAYATPPGFRDEPYLIPFKFLIPADGLVHLGLPWSMDDDVQFVLRGIIFPAIGTAQPLANVIPPVAFPALCRMHDTEGNPLQDSLVLALGVWAQSGFTDTATPTGINAFGFPVEPEVVCAPGGTVLFDFQIPTDAIPASLAYTVGGSTVTFVARVYGTAGNAYSIHIVNPGAPNVALSVAVVASAVTVTLATDGASVITTTLAELAAAVNGSAAAVALMGAILTAGDGSDLATALAATFLANGAAESGTVQELTGTMIGVKRYPECD